MADHQRPRDELDRRILRELKANARASTSAIAARLKVARSTVQERIARMELDKVIAGYSVILARDTDAEKVQILVLLEIRQQDMRHILQKLQTYPEIRLCLSINGEFDLFLTADAPRIEDLDILVDELASISGIVRTKTFVVFGQKFDRRTTLLASEFGAQQ